MKLVVAIIREREKQRLHDLLMDEGITYTKIGSTGGFLRQGNCTLLIGAQDAAVERVLELIRSACKSEERFVNVASFGEQGVLSGAMAALHPQAVSVESGGAVAFVLDVDSFHKF
ncbi:hypothetical protein CCAX7_40240 [Capsulimonas corticalis]|uniref:Uncharacterized protein n=1 Tax=Capsulimonas corticalis TaxID=2219043 RepID=A0A402D4U9_9BACT|nr:cyclic-di-AMP receptor [Capsulimonas corticalis]BDI31973.1 hypothetical protein CCAX7_40240 [Capsulimonas corticalis]